MIVIRPWRCIGSIIKKIGNNAYKLDLQGRYDVSNSFNITDLVPYFADEPDLRTNPFQEGGDDMIMDRHKDGDKEFKDQSREEDDALVIPPGPITRAKARRLKEAVGSLLMIDHGDIWCFIHLVYMLLNWFSSLYRFFLVLFESLQVWSCIGWEMDQLEQKRQRTMQFGDFHAEQS